MKRTHKLNIIFEKIAGLELAKELHKGSMEKEVSRLLSSYEAAAENLIR